ncbi:25-hydroxycholesterol 7-alpha-hydroxylase [Colletotrichum orbiculare MAFF 240422]|uniref:25-hydroxycholesterol 7-alpha-hydroxylase n=1 Tax=Colletotrichum orbiculare (strain 104-T / ATCC 96160 / CBS 514.97 / LARS 414 / MAFF 240422) TaxID=1213857 RepID=A0A484FSL4_COLOR|nr:25-hydroxycholesterol 7-alpha-hydroxylase [Colletotrichum orbiculare MAFF 240422]
MAPTLDFLSGSPVTVVGLLLVVAIVYLSIYPVPIGSHEPPIVRPKVPLVGHILGLFQHSWAYYGLIFEASNREPIVTLPMLRGKVYVAPDPDLASAALRNRALSFDPFLRDLITGIAGAKPATVKVWDDAAFYRAWVKILYDNLSGRPVLALNISAVGNVAENLNSLSVGKVEVGNLYLWNQKMFTLASMNSLYGSENPFRKDTSLVNTYWTYEDNMHRLVPNILPAVFASRGHRARQLLNKAFTSYFDADGHADPSVPPFTRDRRELTAKFGLPPSEAAAIETIVVHGAVSNSYPTYYWMFTHVFSQPDLVARLREETAGVLEVTGESIGGKRVVRLHVDRLEERCPLLTSCFREAHRLRAKGALARHVTADTTLSDGGKRTYAVKRGTQVHSPQGVFHVSRELWGPDAEEFVGDRFLELAAAAGNKSAATFSPRGFLGLGGGKHICPGRGFASGEILGSMALLVSGFDVSGPDGGVLEVPGATEVVLTATFGKPRPGSELRGVISRRAGLEDVHWEAAA